MLRPFRDAAPLPRAFWPLLAEESMELAVPPRVKAEGHRGLAIEGMPGVLGIDTIPADGRVGKGGAFAANKSQTKTTSTWPR